MIIIRRTFAAITAVIACLALTAPAAASGPYSNESGTVSNSTPAPGKSVTVRASGFRPNSEVLVTLNTSPPVRTSTRVNGAGKANARLTIPDNALGAQTIDVVGTAPDGSPRSASIGIMVTPKRGGGPKSDAAMPTAIAAGVALPAGAVLIFGSRLRRRPSRS